MNISDLNKAEVLAALYNNARQQGMGFLNPRGGSGMSADEAQKLLDEAGPCPYFDYLHGRVMKVAIEDELETRLYNRDNGHEAAERVIADLRAKVAA
jgi:hypothetical protein